MCPHPKRQKKTEGEAEGLGARSHWRPKQGRGLDRGQRSDVNDASVLRDAKDCAGTEPLTQPDGNGLQVTKVGTVIFRGGDSDAAALITVSNVYHAPTLTRNLLSLGQLAKRGCALAEKDGSLVIATGGETVFRVRFKHDVLIADLAAVRPTPHAGIALAMSAVMSPAVEDDVERGSLMYFHERFGHLALDTVERIARDPHSGIYLTDHTRKRCVVCAEGSNRSGASRRRTAGRTRQPSASEASSAAT